MKFSILQKKVFTWLLLVSYLNLISGCHRYYKPVRLETSIAGSKEENIKRLNTEGRYFILRKGQSSYAMSNLEIDQSKMTLTADVGFIPPAHQLYILNDKKLKYSYSKTRGEAVVLKEVHIFTGDSSHVQVPGRYTFSLFDVNKIDVIEFDQKRTSKSYVNGALAITLSAALVIMIIVAAASSKPEPDPPPPSSCPYISSFNGEDYQLQGEIYSAAIYPSLQRDDYLKLNIQPVNGYYTIKISNELQEVQHTDLAELVVVEHDKNSKILVDPEGKMHAVTTPESPRSASLNNRTDVSHLLKSRDNMSCLFKDDYQARPTEDVFINFNNEQKSKKGKLILSAKTSSWLNYLFGEFTKGFGSYYTTWAREQEKRPASELEKWSDDQHIPLTVSVKTSKGWKEIQQVKTIGPLMHRDLVIPVALPDGGDVEFKLSGGYMFWELDYAGIDYSTGTDFKVQSIKPHEAINEEGKNVLANILSEDKRYLDQPKVGDATIIKYKSTGTTEGMGYSIFLHSSGYYTPIRNYKGAPKSAFLKSFEQPGSLAAFSRQKFSEVWNKIEVAKN